MLETDANGWQWVNGDFVSTTPVYSRRSVNDARKDIKEAVRKGCDDAKIRRIFATAGVEVATETGYDRWQIESFSSRSDRLAAALHKEWC